MMTEGTIAHSHRRVNKLPAFYERSMAGKTEAFLDRTDQLSAGGVVATFALVFTIRSVWKKLKGRGGRYLSFRIRSWAARSGSRLRKPTLGRHAVEEKGKDFLAALPRARGQRGQSARDRGNHQPSLHAHFAKPPQAPRGLVLTGESAHRFP